MSSPTIESQRAALFDAIADRAQLGLESPGDCETGLHELALWVQYFRSTAFGRAAVELLDGIQSAAIETIAYVSLGLVRAAIASIRLQLELTVGYVYFRDHPQEWERVTRTGDGFMLLSAVDAFNRDIDRKVGSRVTMIEQSAEMSLKGVYRLLSAHVHAQSKFTLPRGSSFASLVASEATMASVAALQSQAILALSNYLVAVLAGRWPELPPSVVSRVNQTLTSSQRREFFGAE